MSWLRTRSGRLVHAVGELAEVHRGRGAVDVDEATALAEVASGAAQAQADIEGDLAGRVDEIVRKADEAKAARDQAQRAGTNPVPPIGELTVSSTRPPLTVEDEKAVQKAIDEETPR